MKKVLGPEQYRNQNVLNLKVLKFEFVWNVRFGVWGFC